MPDTAKDKDNGLSALLHWYAEMGVHETVAETPSDMRQWGPSPKQTKSPPRQSSPITPTPPIGKPPSAPAAPMPADEALAAATELAANADTIEALRAAIIGFEGCDLKQGAHTSVVDDGIPHAELMVLGEAPGREEDRVGRPFVGRAGQLLDRMLAAIHRSRKTDDGLDDVHITNMVYWRPPGNRTPSHAELAICRPFVERMIELSQPKIILLAGNVSAQGLHPGLPGITRARGKWRDFTTKGGYQVKTLPIFHPAYLLRSPQKKRLAWHDLLTAQKALMQTTPCP